ncbi:MAG TPA: hypothetical protein VFQ25_07965 [Ktedonobacterales bacterium]|nr:hypothetical protein [Ktedonobacterales bacterium]
MANPKTGQSASDRSPQPPGSSPTGGAGSSWGSRILDAIRPNFGRNAQGKGSGSRITKLIMGTLIFVLVGQLLVTGMTVLDSVYHLGLQQPVFPGTNWLTWFFLIYAVLLIGLWLLLNYFGFFPKPEPASTTRTSSSSSRDKKAVSQIPGIGGPRARQRRPEAATPAANGRKGATDTGKAAAKPNAAAKTQAASSSGKYDKAYERVKAAQRQKRRRELR